MEAASVPTTCEAKPEDDSLSCSTPSDSKCAKTYDASFGKAFTSGVLSAVKDSGPYRSEVGKVTLECFPRKDGAKSGSKLPARQCQWNDGWDIRTLVRVDGEEMSFEALKEKISSSSYEEAEDKMGELKERLKVVAVQAVQAAKTVAMPFLSQDSSTAAMLLSPSFEQLAQDRKRHQIDDMETNAKAAKKNTDNVETARETKAKAPRKNTDNVEVGMETKAKATIKNTDIVEVGCWVTVQAASRRTVDRAKADAPCLVTLVDSSYAHVLYPNLLSVFLSEKSDGEVAIKFRTEKCDLQSIRAYTADITTLDRKMVINLCQAVAKASTPQAKASIATASTIDPAENPETPAKLSKHSLRGSDWLRKFTARVAQAFKAAGRESMDKTSLHTVLKSDYPSSEISDGMATLESLNKVIVADDAIFLAC